MILIFKLISIVVGCLFCFYLYVGDLMLVSCYLLYWKICFLELNSLLGIFKLISQCLLCFLQGAHLVREMPLSVIHLFHRTSSWMSDIIANYLLSNISIWEKKSTLELEIGQTIWWFLFIFLLIDFVVNKAQQYLPVRSFYCFFPQFMR